MNSRWLVLAALFLVAATLRVHDLALVPNGVYSDEASVAYDAYSLLHTGKDFHGHPLPLFFQSFGEYKNPVFIYAAVPSVAVFGLSAFAARLPAALFGLFAVLAIFLLARRLWGEPAGLLAAFFLAVSPWAVQFSRVAFEAAAFSALFLFALYAFYKGLGSKPAGSKWWAASAVLFALSLYSYGSARLFVPLFVLALAAIHRNELWPNRKKLAAPLAVAIVLVFPLLFTALTAPDVLSARYNVVSIFSPGHSVLEFVPNYFKHYSLDFLFLNGDANLRHSIPGFGQLPLFLLPLVFAGAVLAFSNPRQKTHATLLAWTALSAVPAALTWEGVPHAIRAIAGVGAFELLAALGALFLYAQAKQRLGAKPALALSAIFLLAAFANAFAFSNAYFQEYPAQGSAWFESGLGGAFAFVQANEENYDAVALTPSLDQARMYAAFYLALDPARVQHGDYGKIVQCDPRDCGLDGKRVLYVARANEPPRGQLLSVGVNAAGKAAFKVEDVAP